MRPQSDPLPCLDFVNTVEPREGPVVRDALPDYPALLEWAELVGLLSTPDAEELRHAAGADPAGAARSLRAALRLREALFAMLSALAERRDPPTAPVAVLQRHYTRSCRAARLEVGRHGARWVWARDDLEQIAGRVAADAMALLGSGTVLKRCPPAAGGCGWVFADRTKNGSRRWCSMADCGGTAKSRRQAAKRKAARAAVSGTRRRGMAVIPD